MNNKEKIIIGDIVQFNKIVKGKIQGVEKELYKVVDADNPYWEICDLKLQSLDDNSIVYTTREGVQLAKNITIQLTLF